MLICGREMKVQVENPIQMDGPKDGRTDIHNVQSKDECIKN
jgi:hypothetical protein